MAVGRRSLPGARAVDEHAVLCQQRLAEVDVGRDNAAISLWAIFFDPDLTPGEAAGLLDRFVSWAQRSRLPSFVKLQRTIRAHRAGILAALELGTNNGRTEGLNRKVRALTSRVRVSLRRRRRGMIMLCCGPVDLRLPHDERSHQ